jgi:hypothetical protein
MYRNATTSATRNAVDTKSTRFGVQIARTFTAQILPRAAMWLSRMLAPLSEPRGYGHLRPLPISGVQSEPAGQPPSDTRRHAVLRRGRCVGHSPGSPGCYA